MGPSSALVGFTQLLVEAQMIGDGPIPAEDAFALGQALVLTMAQNGSDGMSTIEFASGACARHLHFVFDLHHAGDDAPDPSRALIEALSHQDTTLSRWMANVDRNRRIGAVRIRLEGVPEILIPREHIPSLERRH